MQVAKIILQQLGGNKFLAMTGAKCLADGNKLIVKLPRSQHVEIELNGFDLYDVKIGKVARLKQILAGAAPVAWGKSVEMVYAENLCEVFEDLSGLLVSL